MAVWEEMYRVLSFSPGLKTSVRDLVRSSEGPFYSARIAKFVTINLRPRRVIRTIAFLVLRSSTGKEVRRSLYSAEIWPHTNHHIGRAWTKTTHLWYRVRSPQWLVKFTNKSKTQYWHVSVLQRNHSALIGAKGAIFLSLAGLTLAPSLSGARSCIRISLGG